MSRVAAFFFSSRRRHTRYIGDWSSDVCSSDLDVAVRAPVRRTAAAARDRPADGHPAHRRNRATRHARFAQVDRGDNHRGRAVRSEERRVGKEWRTWEGRKEMDKNIETMHENRE